MRIRSKAQRGKLFAMERRGEIARGTAIRNAREVKGQRLPRRVKKGK